MTCKFEKKIQLDSLPELLGRSLIGYLDCVDDNNVYEFKCVDQLSNDHYLQLVIYMYLNERQLSLPSLFQCQDSKKTHNKTVIPPKLIIRSRSSLESSSSSHSTIVVTRPKLNQQIFSCSRSYYLYNILKDEIYQVCCGLSDLREIIQLLIMTKYYSQKSCDDQTFIHKMEQIRNRIS